LKEEKMTEQQEWDKERAEQHARWAKMASRLSYAPFARRIVRSLAPLESGSTIVDLGTGPGILSIELHKMLPQAKIIGIDLSSDMLEIARRNADEAGMSNYETRLGRAEEIPVESNSVNLVVTQSSFHEWDDPQKGLSEIFRVLKPGGSVMLKDYNWDWLSGWRRSLLKFLLTMVGESYEDHVGMFKFTFDEVAGLLREAGFDEIKGKARGLQFLIQALKRVR
jgi:ubiquinone/menaquinone biosynthesis C-methylase UbiE